MDAIIFSLQAALDHVFGGLEETIMAGLIFVITIFLVRRKEGRKGVKAWIEGGLYGFIAVLSVFLLIFAAELGLVYPEHANSEETEADNTKLFSENIQLRFSNDKLLEDNMNLLSKSPGSTSPSQTAVKSLQDHINSLEGENESLKNILKWTQNQQQPPQITSSAINGISTINQSGGNNTVINPKETTAQKIITWASKSPSFLSLIKTMIAQKNIGMIGNLSDDDYSILSKIASEAPANDMTVEDLQPNGMFITEHGRTRSVKITFAVPVLEELQATLSLPRAN